jgi:glycosyltransferase involved in cell wall biosynthesis
MGYGACVIARDTVFNREVLGDAAIFFGDAEAVTRAVTMLDGDAHRTECLRRAGPRRVEELYTWTRVVDEYERVFREAARER